MPAGVETYGPNGAVLTSYTSKIARQRGFFFTGTSDGALNFPDLAEGIPWVASFPLGSPSHSNAPAVFREGTTIRWRFVSGMPGDRVSVKVVYGVR